MAVTVYASGGAPTNPAVVGTEHVLASVNQAGVYQGWVDLSTMAAGDLVELRVYRVVKAGGVSRPVHKDTFQGVQDPDAVIVRTEGLANSLTDTDALKFTLKQTAGTGRSFDYSVDKIA